ncbi:MAG: transposase, partial [Bacteroidota bacterium]
MLKIERCDDLPLIGAILKQSNIATIFSEHYKDHGHWLGASGGQTLFMWLLYILSESDHRLSHVEQWGEQNIETLKALTGLSDLRSLDLSDDRLGRLLDRLSKDEEWVDFERSLSNRMVREYKLQAVEQSSPIEAVVRLDSFNIPQHRAEDDFFRRGYSKQRRVDRPFCKAMMAALDMEEVGGDFPLATQLLAGNEADDSNYLPVIKRVRQILGEKNRLYVGDSKIGSHGNRLALAFTGDFYLCPLNGKQCTKEQLETLIDQAPGIDQLPSINEAEGGKSTTYYYELPSPVEMTSSTNGEKGTASDPPFSWQERRVLVHSVSFANDYNKGFDKRLQKAEEALSKLLIRKPGRQVPKTEDALKVKVAKVLQKHHVAAFFSIEYGTEVEESKTKGVRLKMGVTRNEAAIAQQRKRHGWRIFGTNLPKKIPAKRIVELYHDQYRIEHLFDRLINQGTKLLPVYLKKPNRVKALTRLLAIAVQFSMIIQSKLRKAVK